MTSQKLLSELTLLVPEIEIAEFANNVEFDEVLTASRATLFAL